MFSRPHNQARRMPPRSSNWAKLTALPPSVASASNDYNRYLAMFCRRLHRCLYRGEPCPPGRAGLQPLAPPLPTFTVAVCYVRSTSTPAVRHRDQSSSELAAFAEAERDRIRERIGQVKADQKARGRFLGGKVPFGFRRGDDGELVPHAAEQEAIREMVELRAQGRPLRVIVDAVRAREGPQDQPRGRGKAS